MFGIIIVSIFIALLLLAYDRIGKQYERDTERLHNLKK